LVPDVAQDRGLAVIAREAAGSPSFDVGKQYAVIIGIDKYQEWPGLHSAVSEAKAIKQVLAERYYIDEFYELYDQDASAANIRKLFLEILPTQLGIHDSLLVFYAGHGQLDASKTGFWIACDGSKDIYSQSGWIPNAQLRNMLDQLKAQRILILADACFAGDFLNVNRGASPTVDSAYFRRALQLTARQVLSSGASETVPDQSEFGRQLFNLLERNIEPLLDPVSMYERIRLGVTQTEPLLGSLPGNEQGASFVLFLRTGASESSPTAATSTPPTTPTITITRSYGSLAVSVATAGTLYLDGKPMGDLPAGAKATLDTVEVGDRNIEMHYANGQVEQKSVEAKENELTLVSFILKPAPSMAVKADNMVFVQGGTFSMGASFVNWDPPHQVTLSSYYIDKYDVTVADFRAFVDATGYVTQAERIGGGKVASISGKWPLPGEYVNKTDATWKNPYFVQSDNDPVVEVSWYDAIEYCNWVSIQEGRQSVYKINGTDVAADWSANGYRLPTEAEWLYAAQGGLIGRAKDAKTGYLSPSSLDSFAWYNSNSGGKTHPVGQKSPNLLGLYDMIGDVWQWCWDWNAASTSAAQTDPHGAPTGQYRLICGGSWIDDTGLLHGEEQSNGMLYRICYKPLFITNLNGFRLVHQ